MNKYGRNKYSEKINQQEHLKLVIPGKKSHIAEGKQGYQSYDGQVKRGKQHTHYPCSQYDILLFHSILCVILLQKAPAVHDISPPYDGLSETLFY